jgi:hypothetical protein
MDLTAKIFAIVLRNRREGRFKRLRRSLSLFPGESVGVAGRARPLDNSRICSESGPEDCPGRGVGYMDFQPSISAFKSMILFRLIG